MSPGRFSEIQAPTLKNQVGAASLVSPLTFRSQGGPAPRSLLRAQEFDSGPPGQSLRYATAVTRTRTGVGAVRGPLESEVLMRAISVAIAPLLALTMAGASYCQEQPGLTMPAGGNGVSQRAEVSQWVGPVKISIDYHSPAVHRRGVDRTGHIWGELVPFGFFDDGHGPSTATPWRTGANESTTISLSHGVKVGGRDLPAGTYALFLELDKDGPWTWIFSKNLGWGSYQYDAGNDALRVPVQP